MPDETIDTNASTLVSEGATAVADAEAASSSVPVVDTNATAQDQTVESGNNVNAVNPEQTVVEQATPTTTNASNNAINNIDPNKSFEQNVVAMAVSQAHNEALDANAGQSMDNFLTNEYSYNPEEVGSYWVAGGINDTKTQMSFLNAIIQEEMYDQQELGRFSYDTQIAVARAYAAQKKMETAYNYYQIAQQTAISEAALTGFYLPAEARYMLANYEKAQYTLNDPDASDDEKAKARRIAATSGRWWNANGLTDRGIKTLSMMNYEESVRHNEIMFELEKEQQEWQKSYYDASQAEYQVSLRETNLNYEKLELEYGIDLNGDGKYGGSTLGEYSSLTDLLTALPGAFGTMLENNGSETALKNWLSTHINNWTDDMYDKLKLNYSAYVMSNTLLENDYNIKGSNLQETPYKSGETDGAYIYILPVVDEDGNVTVAAYEVEGGYTSTTDTRTYERILDEDYKLSDGRTLKEVYGDSFNTSETLKSNGNTITINGLSDNVIKDADEEKTQDGSDGSNPNGPLTVKEYNKLHPKQEEKVNNISEEETGVGDGSIYLYDNENKKLIDTRNFTMKATGIEPEDTGKADTSGNEIYKDSNNRYYIKINGDYYTWYDFD